MFIVIEMADVELLSVRAFHQRADADACFESCAEENGVSECFDLDLEIATTLRLAGDHVYSVQLISREVQGNPD